MADNPFPGVDPFGGLNPVLIPHPPAATPEAPEVGDAMARLSPFKEALDADKIIENLTLDRPLKLYIPGKEKYPDYEFRIINSIPSEMADAHNKGWKEITDPELTKLFVDLVAGTDKDGKSFRPILCARAKKVGDHVRRQHRMQLRSLYAGMDPQNKEFSSKYAKNEKTITAGDFSGANWRIRV